MEGKPKRLRPWLVSLISRGEIAGLEWINDEKNIFKIPWKHRGKHDWSPENSRIFMEWAKQTGRYREGIDSPDYPAWKTRLRCAFNKAPDIEEVKELSKLDAAFPYRVYRLKPPTKQAGVPTNGRLTPKTAIPHHYHPSPFRSATPYNNDHDNMINHSFDNRTHIKVENVDEVDGRYGYYNSPSSNACPGDDQKGYFSRHQSGGLQADGGRGGGGGGGNGLLQQLLTNGHRHHRLQTQVKLEIEHSPNVPLKSEVDVPLELGHEMIIKVMYSGKEVLDRVIRRSSGCRICYGSCPISPFGQIGLTMATDFFEPVYGPSHAETVFLPDCHGLMTNDKQEKSGRELLERGLQRGLVLTCKDHNIYAYRLCQSAVFFSNRPGTGGKPVKLRRGDQDGAGELVKLFDYKDQYIPALKDYLDGQGAKPDPRCYLVFGQEVSLNDIDSNVLIVVTVSTQQAIQDLAKAEAQMSVRTPKVEVSNSGELDHLARDLRNLCQPPPLPSADQPNLVLQYSPSITDEQLPPMHRGQSSWYPMAPASTLLSDTMEGQPGSNKDGSDDMDTDVVTNGQNLNTFY